MESIQLPRGKWFYDPDQTLGKPGGFGTVFAGRDSAGAAIAVKRLHVRNAAAGHRELKIADELAGRGLRHVVPILDAGLDQVSEHYFIVMAQAAKSLQALLDEQGPMSEAQAAAILDDIAAGLEEIPDLVHRDLKPDNVLLHEGMWKLADLGIARFVEEATSLNTLRDCLTPGYAAPEQWRSERATSATDVYALGCIAHALLTGQPPFRGMNREELCHQHLEAVPPALDASPRFRGLVAMCLLKPPGSRPAIGAVRFQLARARNGHQERKGSSLAAAGAALAEQRASTEAAGARAARERRSREEMAHAGLVSLRTLMNELFSEIKVDAPLAEMDKGRDLAKDERSVGLGFGHLYFKIAFPFVEAESFARSKWNVVAGAIIGVTQRGRQYPGRFANLWYADIKQESALRWWEVPYMTYALIPRRRRYEPFGLEHEVELPKADAAGANLMDTVQLAAQPIPIDLEHQEAFFDRWMTRLAKVSTGELPSPTHLPE